MATRITDSNLNNARYYPTSALHSVLAETENPSVAVNILYDHDGQESEIFSTTLYAYQGIVELSNVGQLIERYFRRHKLVAGMILLRFDESEIRVHCLYCETPVTGDFSAESTLFLASTTQRVHQDSFITIAAEENVFDLVFEAVCHDEDGGITVSRWIDYPQMSQCSRQYSVADIINDAMSLGDTDNGKRVIDVLYFSISYGNLQKMFYILPHPAYITFSFRNSFNVEEFVDVVGNMTTKTEMESAQAVSSRRILQYDREVSRFYEVQTEVLSPSDFATFEQFLTSSAISLLMEDGSWAPVIINDFTCENNSDDESLSSVKFTWQFAESWPRVYNHVFNGVMPTRRKIFDPVFSAEYE